MSLRSSSTHTTLLATAMHTSHWAVLIDVVLNSRWNGPRWVTANCSASTPPSADHSHRLCNVSRWNSVRVSCRALRMLQNWKSTNASNAIVPATLAVPACAAPPGAHASSANVPAAMVAAEVSTATHRSPVRIRSPRGLGGCNIASPSAPSSPSAIAGGPSMMRFTQRMAIAVNGLPPATSSAAASRNTSAKPSVVLSWKRTNFTMLA